MRHVTRRQALIAASLGGALAAAIQPTSVRADQPHMHAALDALRTAEQQLKEAVPDKGGHRVKALQLVKDAIIQVEKGIEYDRRH
jgi:hypothetical protein